MSLTKRLGLLSGAAAITLTGSAMADADVSKDELLSRLAAAEAKIADLSNANSDNWLTEQRSEEIKDIVYDVLADADTRASMLQSGMTAGYDNGAVIGSSDGNWMLRTNLLMQQRFIWNEQDEDAAVDTSRWGFDNPRSRLIFSGHVVNQQWFYRLDVNFGNGTVGNSSLNTTNAYLGYDYNNGWKVTMGTFKTALLREELVEAQNQLAVERSVLNYLFTGGYTDGLQLAYEGEQMRFTGQITDGGRTGQTAWNAFDTEFAIAARAEFLLSGTWGQFSDFTSARGNEQGLMLGVAGTYQNGEADGTGILAGDTEIWAITGDVSWENDGWNLFGSVTYADVDQDVMGGADFNPLAILVQGGYYINDDTELFARYEWADLDLTGVEDINILTVGFNHYVYGHNAKWTTDFGYAFDAVQFSNVPALTGWRADAGDEDGQMVVRSQFQILF